MTKQATADAPRVDANGRAIRLAKRAAIAACVVVAATGLLHTRAGRPLLAKLGGGAAGACPILVGMSPQTLEDHRVAAMKPLAGEARAPTRAALAFTLATTTRGEVTAWTTSHGLACKDDVAGTAWRCADVDPKALDDGQVPIDDLFFVFDPAGKLVALDVMHKGASADDASRLLDDAFARLRRVLGSPPTATSGDRTSTYLTSAPLAQAAIEYRFRNLAVDVSATNFGDRGVIVREQYRAIPD
jgi:hypothetical protein